MADFLPICKWVIEQEDMGLTGKVVNLMDGGGRTRFGIAEHWNAVSSDFYTKPVADAFIEASSIYRQEYWDAFKGDEILGEQIASCLLSFSINDGTKRAVKTLQECLGFPAQAIDGIFGQETLLHTNGFSDIILSAALRAAQADYYRAIVAEQPTDVRFLTGWLARAKRIYPSLD